MSEIVRIVVHCSATPPSVDWRPDDIIRVHMAAPPDGNGWSRPGYHYLICRDGSLHELVRPGELAFGAKGFNQGAVHVCLVGGVSEHKVAKATFEPAQFETLRKALDFLELRYSKAATMGHRDLPGVLKDCPSFNVRHWRATGQIIEERKPI